MNAFHRLHQLRMENDEARYRQSDKRERFDRIKDGPKPRAVSAFQLFQTPPDLASRLVALVPADARRILEPSAGLGRLLDALPPGKDVTAVEISPDLCRALYEADRPGVRILQRDFLSLDPVPEFDAVVMNPPFHMRADIAHILHALGFLRSGGTLAALCMDTPHREKALRHLSATWEPVPAGTFRKEGTETPCVLLSIIKP